MSTTAIDRPAPPLHTPAWDRWFVAGGAWLVPVPIAAFLLCQAAGLSVAAAEDVVTLLVMVPLGGPHVFATYTRTYLNPKFRREEPLLFGLGLAVPLIIVTAVVASAFFDVTIAGSPPMRYVLTFFFFWAGLHIVQQHAFVHAALPRLAPRAKRWDVVEVAVMLLAMYPASLFRMSMVDTTDASMRFANPDALATRVVTWLGGSAQCADDYVFRIGRVAPALPGWLLHPAVWIAVTVAFAIVLALFVARVRHERRRGIEDPNRTRLVASMALVGATVPLLPNLDSAFQGLNAWHSFQYLGIAWLMNRRSLARGEIDSPWFARIAADGAQWRFYRTALGATLAMVAALLGTAWLLTRFGGGEFAMFGHDEPLRDAAGNALYRPGAVLLAYYLLGFSLLLVHYLHDGVFFCRRRYLRGSTISTP
ncbi:MAG: hypothetical protein JNL08_10130 [Planctomycetes bacterium]|nr:hypothetical protein [Planctomycetota bacterium]